MDEILSKLKVDANFRERCNKNLGIAQLLKEKYHLDIDLSRLKVVIEDASSYDRYWRLLTREYPEYRGFDYDTKKKVVQRKQISLGYESGFHELSQLSKKL